MKKNIFISFLLLMSLFLMVSCSAETTAEKNISPDAVFTATFIINLDQSVENDIYIMGDFNNWVPGDEMYRASKKDDYTYEVTLQNKYAKKIEYLYNQGNIFTIEADSFGDERENRTYTFDFNNDQKEDYVSGWTN